MAHAFPPGLQVTARTILRKRRLLPLRGEVLVDAGQQIEAETVIARAELPGDIHPVNVANRLGVQPAEVRRYMLKDVGDTVDAQEPIAETKPWIKFLKTSCLSPVRGSIQSISDVTGQVMVQQPPRPVELQAYLPGRVVEVIPNEGAIVETPAALVQGIFGIGGECAGRLMVVAESPDEVVSASTVSAEWHKSVVVVGSVVTADLIGAAADEGAAALVGAAIGAAELRTVLGYDIGVAVTGAERVGLTIVLTEGFGQLAMARRTFDLLRQMEGRAASVNGATQIRAGVQRPEIIVPLDARDASSAQHLPEAGADGLRQGDPVRLIREPYFGVIGRVVELVPELQTIETEATVRVMRVEMEDGRTVSVPRANVETIKT